MKYSIDFHNNHFSGWVGNSEKEVYIRLSTAFDKSWTVELTSDRPDIMALGFSNQLKCGFVFKNFVVNNEKHDGNLFLVEILDKSSDTVLASKSFFVGDLDKWKHKFEEFQVIDRKDFTIQQRSYEEIFAEHPDIIAFKLLMIRLRRGKRAFGWRGSFSGNQYEYMQQDWEFFRAYYIKYFSTLSNILSIRSLWSILDTFADFGTHLERLAALSISNMMYQERFAQTYRQIYDLEPLAEVKTHGQTHYWGMMFCNQLVADDSYDVFLTRNLEVLDEVPIVKKTFCKIFIDSLQTEQSIAGMNKAFSPYFKEAFEFYNILMTNYMNKR